MVEVAVHKAERTISVNRTNIISLCDKPLGDALSSINIRRGWQMVCSP